MDSDATSTDPALGEIFPTSSDHLSLTWLFLFLKYKGNLCDRAFVHMSLKEGWLHRRGGGGPSVRADSLHQLPPSMHWNGVSREPRTQRLMFWLRPMSVLLITGQLPARPRGPRPQSRSQKPGPSLSMGPQVFQLLSETLLLSISTASKDPSQVWVPRQEPRPSGLRQPEHFLPGRVH